MQKYRIVIKKPNFDFITYFIGFLVVSDQYLYSLNFRILYLPVGEGGNFTEAK